MPKRHVVALLAVFVILAGAVAVRAATPDQAAHSSRRAAAHAAVSLLGQVVLPTGATRIAGELAGDAHQLAFPMALFLFADEVERHGFWTTGASPNAVIGSIERHLPTGFHRTGWGHSATSASAWYSRPAAEAFGPATLDVDAVALANGATGVRVDAAVRYWAPRPASQRVPDGSRVLYVTMAKPGSRPVLSLTVTRRGQVRRIAAIVDRLPFVASLRGVAISCPAIMPAPIVTLSFRGRVGGRILARVSEPADTATRASPCALTALTIRGHRERGLLEGGVLLRKAGQILGVQLTSRP